MFRAVPWLFSLLCAGCYLSHPLGEAGDGGRRRDSGMSFRDADALGDRVVPDDRFIPGEDSGLRDGGRSDSGRIDAGRMDAGEIDAGRIDAGRPDSGRRDAGLLDAGPPRSVALHFDRSRRLIVPAAPGLDLTGNHTLEFWIRPLGEEGVAILKGNRDANFHHGVFLERGEIEVGWRGGAGRHTVSAPIGAGDWTHVAMVYELAGDGTMLLTLLLNGEVVAVGSFPADIGGALNDMQLIFGNVMAVDLDEVRLWSFARRPEGIRITMGRRISPATPGLVAYWQIEEFGGQIVLDRTLNGHDAILGDLTMPDPADPTWIGDGPI